MLSRNEEIENVTFQALAHPTRRIIIRILQSRNQGVSYTELITELGLSTGKLNYHLEQLKGLMEKNANHYYVLTPFGKKVVEHLNLVEQRTSSEDEKYVKAASSAQNASLQPIMKAFLSIGIAAMAFLLFFWGYIGYIATIEGAPSIIYVILPVLLGLGLCVLGLLIYALAKAPLWIRRLERKYFGEIQP
jgi:predicted transcriptional regulator